MRTRENKMLHPGDTDCNLCSSTRHVWRRTTLCCLKWVIFHRGNVRYCTKKGDTEFRALRTNPNVSRAYSKSIVHVFTQSYTLHYQILFLLNFLKVNLFLFRFYRELWFKVNMIKRGEKFGRTYINLLILITMDCFLKK